MEQAPDRRATTAKLSTNVFIAFSIIGALLFYLFQYALLGGLGLGLSLFGLVSWFHFKKRGLPQYNPDIQQTVDTKMTWFLFTLAIVGILILIFNMRQNGPEFYNGIAAGLVFTCAVAYVIELLLNWFSSFR